MLNKLMIGVIVRKIIENNQGKVERHGDDQSNFSKA
jgi:hypothetical protein